VSIRDLVRVLPVLARPLPAFAAEDTPAGPTDLFVAWLRAAAAAGVVEPHVMTVSTVDADGVPDARIVLLREVDERGWHFATDAISAKGQHLAAHPVACLVFYWPEQGRQVRVRGPVAALDREACAQDFRTRSPLSRAASLAGPQSAVLPDLADLDRAVSAAERRVASAPDTVSERHTVYVLSPSSVEFWQGDPDPRHVRQRYRAAEDGTWAKELLWP
jgi:pyridoxamine 5'-phosphate oxidase